MKRLHPGVPVPPFQTNSIDGSVIDTGKMEGKKWLLSFFRYAECMYCNLRVHDLILREKEWKKKGFEMVAVFQSPRDDMLKYVDKQAPEFALIADPERKLYKQYKVEERNWLKWIIGVLRLGRGLKSLSKGFGIRFGYGSTALVPADFLINPDGTIHTAYYGSDITDHLPIKEIEAFIEAS